MSAEVEHIWSGIRAELALALDEATYRIWLEPLRARELVGQRLTLEASPQARGWVTDRFGRLLDSCAAKVVGPGASVELVDRGAAAAQPASAGPLRSRRPRARTEAAPRDRLSTRIASTPHPSHLSEPTAVGRSATPS